MKIILNERTNTVHKRETGEPDLHAACGVTNNLPPDQIRVVPLDQTATDRVVTKCGRCFDDGGGY